MKYFSYNVTVPKNNGVSFSTEYTILGWTQCGIVSFGTNDTRSVVVHYMSPTSVGLRNLTTSDITVSFFVYKLYVKSIAVRVEN